MIKVIQVCSDSNIGGAGKCILTFLNNYNRDRFDVSVVLPRNSLLRPLAEDLKVKVFEVEHLAEKSFDSRAVSRLRKLFRYLKPDIVHTHASMSARAAAKLLGIKVVYTRHSVFPPSPKLTGFPGKQIYGWVNNHTADHIIAVAEAARENLTDTGVNPEKIQVVLNGVEPLKLYDRQEREKAREKLGLGADQKAAAIVARLNEVKGHKYLVEAADILRERGVDSLCLIAGTGEMEEPLREMIAQRNLQDRVKMLGFVKNVEPLMNAMDVQVNCSFGTEATSLSLLEGMSLGKPAVVSDFGGNPGVIQDGVNGFLTPTHNAEALADGLQKLFEDHDLYRTLSENAVNIFKTTFTAEVNTRTIEGIYTNLYDAKTNQENGGDRDEN